MTENSLQTRRNFVDNIHLQPWTCVLSECKQQLLMKRFFSCDQDPVYTVMCYDGKDVWEEKMNEQRTMQKCKTLNRNIEAPLERILSFINEAFVGTKNFTLQKEGEKLEVCCKWKLSSGIPFMWNFSLVIADSNMVGEEVVAPLLSMICELNRRQALLMKEITDRDKQIEDYQLQGCTLTRKRLETVPFNCSSFYDKRNLHKEFTDSCTDVYSTVNTPVVSDLYRNVRINQHCNATKDDLPEPLSPIAPPTFDTAEIFDTVNNAETWDDGRIPPSLVTDPTTHSPPKDNEEERRIALKKRLENETLRKQKKKRKLNI